LNVENDVLEIGTLVERYEVLGLLGQGGLARVYRVRHTQLGTIHALKLLALGRDGMAERLLLEGRIQAQLRHPNIVNVSDVVQFEGQPGLVIEFVSGPTLEDWLKSEGPPSIDEALELFAQIIAAVRAAHQIGVLHRDLKPANVLLEVQASGKFVPKVADFGIAKVALGLAGSNEVMSRTQSGVAMGTPGYMAPEQFNDAASADARADVFSLGTILYELLTGVQAFAEASLLDTLNAVAHGKYRPLPELNPNVPLHVAEAVQRAVRPSPADRYADCESLAAAVLLHHPELLAIVVRGAPGQTVSFTPRQGGAAAGFGGGSTATRKRGSDDGAFPNNTLIAPDWSGESGPVTYLLDPAAAPAEDAVAAPDRRPARAIAAVAIAIGIGLAIWFVVGKPSEPVPVAPPSAPVAATSAADVSPKPSADLSDSVAPVLPVAPTSQLVPTAVGERVSPGTPVAAEAPVSPEAPVAAVVAPSPAPEVPAPVTAVDAPAVVEAAPVAIAESPVIANVLGEWRGRWNGRPLTLRIESQSGAAVRARVEVLLGTTPRSWSTSGTFDGTKLTLKGDDGFKMAGTLSGTKLSGMFETTGQKSSSWDAAR
jgi:serine/threonine protein kinase